MRNAVQVSDLAAAAATLSQPRLSSYRHFFSANTDAEVFGLYRWNEAVSMHMFKVLSLTEIAIRNQFHKALSARYGVAGGPFSKDWYGYLKLGTKSSEAIKKITHKRRGGNFIPIRPTPTPDDVVSKLTFGFWTHLLDVEFDTFNTPVVWSTLLPNVVVGHRQRKDTTYWSQQRHQDAIFARLDFCNNLRNRIAHHEPIWKAGKLMEERRDRPGAPPIGVVEMAPATIQDAIGRLSLSYDRVLELLGWMSPSLLNLHKLTETHFQTLKLLSHAGISHFRSLGITQSLHLESYRTLSSFKKRLRYLSRRGAPVSLHRNFIPMGHWITLPF